MAVSERLPMVSESWSPPAGFAPSTIPVVLNLRTCGLPGLCGEEELESRASRPLFLTFVWPVAVMGTFVRVVIEPWLPQVTGTQKNTTAARRA